jgi:hypothetical protein
MVGKDYTYLPLGTKIDSGEIQVCPHCAKHGLLEVVNGNRWFTHSQSIEAVTLRIQWTMCPRVMPPE